MDPPLDLKTGTFVAVYSNEDPFFLAKIINANNRGAIKIKWFEKRGKIKRGIKYSISYDDIIHERSIICEVKLTQLTRFLFSLTLKEEAKILDVIRQSSDTEDETITHKGEQNIPSPVIPDTSNRTKNQSPISTANIVGRIIFNECQSIFNVSPPSLNENQKHLLLGSTPVDKVKVNDVESIDAIFENLNFHETESMFNGPLLFLNYTQKELLLGQEENIFENSDCNQIETYKRKPIDKIKSNDKESIDIDLEKELLLGKAVKETEKNNHNQNGTSENEKSPKIVIHSNFLINEGKIIKSTQETLRGSYVSLTECTSILKYPETLETQKEEYDIEYFETLTTNTNTEDTNTEFVNVGTTVDENEQTPTPPFADSGSEYVPSTDQESDTEMSFKKSKNSGFYCLKTHGEQTMPSPDVKIPLTKDIQVSFSDLKIQTKQVKKKSATEAESDISLSDASNESEKKIFVKCSKKTAAGNRVYDKKHFCYFCYKPMSKMTRHLALVHNKETEICRLLALPENAIERKEGFLCILRAGDYYHNVEVLTIKKGELILSRRPMSILSLDYRKYGPCPNCLGFFLISNLWHHIKYNCPKKTSLTESGDGKYISKRDIRGESYALISQNLDVPEDYKTNILANLKTDDVGEICRQDEVIRKLGSLLYEKYSSQQHEHIRQTMRQISRLVLEVKKLNSKIKTLQESMLPKNFDVLIAAVQQLCVANRNEAHSRCYNIPSLALKLGHSLRKCALIVRGIALRKGDLTLNREMESFIDLMTLEWNVKISSAALRTLREKQINATQLLPITSDIMKLNRYLDLIINELVADKNLMLSLQSWQKLAQATLCRIVLFNKRRSGEASRMTLQQYAVRPNWSEQCTLELKESLTPLENNLANNLTVVEVVGKSRKNFKVPILLTHATKSAINKLIETRDQVGIARDNIYVFARGSGSKKALRGHDCLRKFTKEAELQQPATLTSTKLRKYIATVVQVLDLKSNEYDWLARHLGHDIRIHRDFYRLHESAVELTKVSRLLLTLDRGEVNKFKGKSLEEINIAELSDLESEEENVAVSDDNEVSDNDVTNQDATPSTSALPTSALPRVLPQRRTWSTQEKEVLLKFFRINIRHGIVPKKEEAEKCIAENKPILESRSWRDVKNWIYNKIRSLKGKNKD